MKEAIEQQICNSLEYYEAVKPENQKLFPFYLHTNFNSNRDYPAVVYERNLVCSYCNQEIESGHGGYYTAHIVFETPTDIRLCCNVYHCRPNPKPYTYHEQSYGYPNPIIFPEKYTNSLRHLVVVRCFLSSAKMYALNKYLKTCITWHEFDDITGRNTYAGGSHVYPDGAEAIKCDWRWDGNHLTTMFGEKIKLTKTEIVNVVNEILEANRPIQVQQLSLF